jgi:GDP-L-fucose synthase|tara:strand:+ start:858 stop:1844 length:987 start_codon:yes stop_codon:yes gene_type:complete
MDKDAKIYVAGHAGMVGSAIVRKLEAEGFKNLIFKTRKKLDLLNQTAVKEFYTAEKPRHVINAAARVGGIHANNTYGSQFIYENLQIQNNLIHYAYESGVTKLLFLGSSCIYPRNASQPMKEEYLLTGELESTNEPYALAKIAGIKMCESYYRQYGCQFFSVMPTNTYGPNDNYDLDTSHALPALIRKIQEAKVSNARKVTVWGSGKPLREFIHVDDIADACVFIMGLDFRELYEQGLTHLNVGTGNEITIRELAELISGIVGFSGDFIFDQSMPDGTPRKLLDVSRINELGWRHQISLEEGIKALCGWYMENFQPFENKTYSKTLAS